MKLPRCTLMILVLVVALSSGCGDDPIAPEELLLGTWERTTDRGLFRLTLRADGSLTGAQVEDNTTIEGTYTLEGGTLTFFDDECGPTVGGVYQFSVTEQSLQFTVINDACSGRRDAVHGVWASSP